MKIDENMGIAFIMLGAALAMFLLWVIWS